MRKEIYCLIGAVLMLSSIIASSIYMRKEYDSIGDNRRLIENKRDWNENKEKVREIIHKIEEMHYVIDYIYRTNEVIVITDSGIVLIDNRYSMLRSVGIMETVDEEEEIPDFIESENRLVSIFDMNYDILMSTNNTNDNITGNDLGAIRKILKGESDIDIMENNVSIKISDEINIDEQIKFIQNEMTIGNIISGKSEESLGYKDRLYVHGEGDGVCYNIIFRIREKGEIFDIDIYQCAKQ